MLFPKAKKKKSFESESYITEKQIKCWFVDINLKYILTYLICVSTVMYLSESSLYTLDGSFD